jgi:NTE family protein
MNDGGQAPLGVALALGGGAALGWAHIGVVRALMMAGIPIAGIVGTSMGALVGACVAAGKLDALEHIARTMKWSRIFRMTDLRLGSAGLVGGDRISAEMRHQLGDPRIEDLALPFAAVACDLTEGRLVVFDSGNTVDAVRASISLPGVFTPVRQGNRLLVDGGMMEPLPIAAARALCGAPVVAVNVLGQFDNRPLQLRTADDAKPVHPKAAITLPSRLFGRQQGVRPSVPAVLSSSFALMMHSLIQARLALYPPDVYIAPDISAYTPMSFDRAGELISLGHTAALRAMPLIKASLQRAAAE